jgi:hypothetical protein
MRDIPETTTLVFARWMSGPWTLFSRCWPIQRGLDRNFGHSALRSAGMHLVTLCLVRVRRSESPCIRKGFGRAYDRGHPAVMRSYPRHYSRNEAKGYIES